MVTPHSRKISWQLIPTILFILGACFTACTQGQGPVETPDKVTVAGTEAPPSPVDVCEKPENLDNILCKWVATNISAPSGAGGGTPPVDFLYDQQGRITKMFNRDKDGNETALINFVYDDFGLYNMTQFHTPVPPDSSNYTDEDSTTYYHNAQTGALTHVIEEEKKNGVMEGGEVTMFAGDGLSSVMAEQDGTGNTVKKTERFFTKDPVTGKNVKIEEKEYPMATDPVTHAVTQGSLEEWSITEVSYLPNGRLERIQMDEQNCFAKACGADPEPTQRQTITPQYDDQGRMAKFIITGEGQVNGNQVVSAIGDPPDPDTTEECVMNYEIKSQAKIAGTHPLEFFITSLAMTGFELGFGERDLFSNITCTRSGQAQGSGSINMNFKWARLWEVLPEGKPPGN